MSVNLRAEITPDTRQPPARIPSTIGILPQDIFTVIFSYLNETALQVTTCVNRGLSNRVKAAANVNAIASIKYFINILTLNGDIFLRQREMLVEISENITPQNFENLRLLKGYILDVKAQLINVMKTVDGAAVNALKNNVPPPHVLEDIFELAVFEREIDAANLIPDETIRGRTLHDISERLAQSGHFDKAITVATSMSENTRGDALLAIAKLLAQAGKIERVIAVVRLISNEI